MFSGLEPYGSYREAGPVWAPHTPGSWAVLRLKSVVSEQSRKGFPDEPLLAATQSRGVILKNDYETRTVEAQKSLETLKLVEVDDFVISLRSFQGGIERAHARGIISPAYSVLRMKQSGDRDYFTLLFKSSEFIDGLKLTVTGIREGQNIEYPRLARDVIPVPPAEEQAAIVKYLGHAHARIDRAIAAKRKLIALLEEQRQAIIHQAVTRGLDPSVLLKDSGIPWLGQIPAHWEVPQLGRLTRGPLEYGANEAAIHTNEDWPRYLRITDFGFDGGLRAGTFRSLPPDKAARYTVTPGDVLFARSGATVGKAFLVPRDIGDACFAGYLIRARVDQQKIMPEYLFAFTRSAAYVRWRDTVFNRATIENIGADKFARLVVPTPPLFEQAEILGHVVRANAVPDAAIDRMRPQIELLGEFRTRLTSDVVTGQVDVREIAASLPELTGELLAAAVDIADADADDESDDDRLDDDLELAGPSG